MARTNLSPIQEITQSEQTNLNQCPYLGIREDPSSVAGYPSRANHCLSLRQAKPVEFQTQRTLCLTANFIECKIYQQAPAVTEPDTPLTAGDPKRRFSPISLLASAALLLLIPLVILASLFLPRFNLQAAVDPGRFFDRQQAAESTIQPGISQQGSTPEPMNLAAPNETAAPAATISAYHADSLTIEPQLSRESKNFLQIEGPFLDIPAAPVSAADVAATETKTPLADRSATSEYDKIERPPQLAISDLPDLFERFQIVQGDLTKAAELNGAYDPLIYQGDNVEIPTIDIRNTVRIYSRPEAARNQTVELSMFELVYMLGRDESGDWVLTRTESGIEGWVHGAETELGDLDIALPVVEVNRAAYSAVSQSTSLPMRMLAISRPGELILHSAPGESFTSIGSTHSEETVGLLGRWQDGPWVRIRLHDGTEGWVRADSLDILDIIDD